MVVIQYEEFRRMVELKLVTGVNDLETFCKQNNREDLLREWDYDKNDILPSQISKGSSQKVWWKCSKGHSYLCSNANKTNGKGCPYCSGQKVLAGYNDLQSQYPELAKEFDIQRNKILPSQVSPGSNNKFWWVCPKGHSFEQSMAHRTKRGQGCPYCSNHKVLKGFNDLQTLRPDLAQEFDIEKNGVLPDEIVPGSNQKFWWKCSVCGNEWQAQTSNRLQGFGCPSCGRLKLSKAQKQNSIKNGNTLAKKYPELAKEFDVEKNGFTPDEIAPASNQDVWWVCSKGHSFFQSPGVRTGQGTGCPYCANKKILAGYNDLGTMEPDLAKQWNYEKNGQLTPQDVGRGSHQKVWWVCDKGHEWEATVTNRATHGRGCPYCAGQKVLAGYNDLVTTNPEILVDWDYEKNGDLSPRNISVGCSQSVWWVCDRGHSYTARPIERANGNGCPYCSGHKVLAGFNDMETTNPELAQWWDYEKNGDLTPNEITQASGKKVWWKCPKGHSWMTAPCNRTRGEGCPTCAALRTASTPEKLAYHYLNLAFGDKYQIIPNDRNVLENGTELDIYIPELKIGIEYDGAFYHDKNSQRKELRKNKLCKEKGIDLIRIRQKGLSNMEDCYCILRDNESMSDMDECISAMLDYILTTTGIDIPYDIYSIGGDDDFINCKRDKQVAIDLRDNM